MRSIPPAVGSAPDKIRLPLFRRALCVSDRRKSDISLVVSSAPARLRRLFPDGRLIAGKPGIESTGLPSALRRPGFADCFQAGAVSA